MSEPVPVTATVTVNDANGNPLDGVAVWITTDEEGLTVVAGATPTNTFGQVSFQLDLGVGEAPATYYVWKQLSEYNAINPEIIVVEAVVA